MNQIDNDYKKTDEWRNYHHGLIKDFLSFLNKATQNYVLKGGTALMLCYGMPRFSEDIDLDAERGGSFFRTVKQFCLQKKLDAREAKDTNTVKRAIIHYPYHEHDVVLKVELSLRKLFIDNNSIQEKNGIRVYNINELCRQKLNAYQQRDQIRDLSDTVYMVHHYWNEFDNVTKSSIQNAFIYKGLDYVEWLLYKQPDPLINSDQLLDDFIKMDKYIHLDLGDRIHSKEKDPGRSL